MSTISDILSSKRKRLGDQTAAELFGEYVTSLTKWNTERWMDSDDEHDWGVRFAERKSHSDDPIWEIKIPPAPYDDYLTGSQRWLYDDLEIRPTAKKKKCEPELDISGKAADELLSLIQK